MVGQSVRYFDHPEPSGWEELSLTNYACINRNSLLCSNNILFQEISIN